MFLADAHQPASQKCTPFWSLHSLETLTCALERASQPEYHVFFTSKVLASPCSCQGGSQSWPLLVLDIVVNVVNFSLVYRSGALGRLVTVCPCEVTSRPCYIMSCKFLVAVLFCHDARTLVSASRSENNSILRLLHDCFYSYNLVEPNCVKSFYFRSTYGCWVTTPSNYASFVLGVASYERCARQCTPFCRCFTGYEPQNPPASIHPWIWYIWFFSTSPFLATLTEAWSPLSTYPRRVHVFLFRKLKGKLLGSWANLILLNSRNS